MLRFLLTFIAGFSIVFYFLNKNNKREVDYSKDENDFKFPPEPPKFESTDKFFNILKEFNKIKREI
ncbi:MAG: hypothetical protein DSY66_02920 [Persephonella sp.]|nr:MAG: hypothetical protein DSY53_02480 [Persephonella sp.]RUM61128.1 MAG: hypothetical protein DSY66_02920 [Persephonella sp.]